MSRVMRYCCDAKFGGSFATSGANSVEILRPQPFFHSHLGKQRIVDLRLDRRIEGGPDLGILALATLRARGRKHARIHHFLEPGRVMAVGHAKEGPEPLEARTVLIVVGK